MLKKRYISLSGKKVFHMLSMRDVEKRDFWGSQFSQSLHISHIAN